MKTSRQLLDLIKNKSKILNINPQILLRRYFMEHFLERLSISNYKNDFILKGGILISSLVGLNIRTTLDIDVSITNTDLNITNIQKIIEEISEIYVDDNIKYRIASIKTIRDEFEYPGLRITFDVFMDKIQDFLQIDITTGDVITPNNIEYDYPLFLENKTINLKSYNLETIIAEKLQTILFRSIENTRMRDFYDLFMFNKLYSNKIDKNILFLALQNTCSKRNTIQVINNSKDILLKIKNDTNLNYLWNNYLKKSKINENIEFNDTIESILNILSLINL